MMRVPPVASEIMEAVMAQLQHGPHAPSSLYGDGQVSERIAEVLAALKPYTQKRLAYEERQEETSHGRDDVVGTRSNSA